MNKSLAGGMIALSLMATGADASASGEIKLLNLDNLEIMAQGEVSILGVKATPILDSEVDKLFLKDTNTNCKGCFPL